MKRTYCAISKNGKYYVATVGPCNDFRIVGNARPFDDFDEANDCAIKMSEGHYNSHPGNYINMR